MRFQQPIPSMEDECIDKFFVLYPIDLTEDNMGAYLSIIVSPLPSQQFEEEEVADIQQKSEFPNSGML